MSSEKWTKEEIPDQSGRVAVVTGGNSGIGLEAARALAEKGAEVIIAVRSVDRGRQARDEILAKAARASVEVAELDLASLDSVRRFAAEYGEGRDRLDLLINNAGVMAVPQSKTKDGFEMQLGTNHLGHFALTGLLYDTVTATDGSRVVTVSSTAHTSGEIDFDDLMAEESYSKWGRYCQSKLANLLFAYELQRRLVAAGVDTNSIGVHPGYAATNLQKVGTWWMTAAMSVTNVVFAQSAEMGALPTLYAATSPDAIGGSYVGPGGMRGMRGYPATQPSAERSHDEAVAKRLWDVSEELTGVKYG
ncbi:MAG: oxidoreductase [Solirubrobacterales bacterium]